MNILALDTSLGCCSAALLRAESDARRLYFVEEKMARGHAEALLPMVGQVMEESGQEFAALDLIAATLGPGTFTGIRVAISAARGFALATNAKLWGTDTLSVMAESLLTAPELAEALPFAIAVDARREHVYFGAFGADGSLLLGPALLSADEAAEKIPEGARLVFGSGAASLAAAAQARGLALDARRPELQPSARFLAERAFKTGESMTTLSPLYLRPPDAKPQTGAAVPRQ